MYLGEIGLDVVDWIHLAQDRGRAPVNIVMNFRVACKAGNFLTT
jgi:hypothetical protein